MDKDKLLEILEKYFNLDKGDTYCYHLTRVKEARQYETLKIDDFKEFDYETIKDLAEYIIKHLES